MAAFAKSWRRNRPAVPLASALAARIPLEGFCYPLGYPVRSSYSLARLRL
jgi:hypothetical protein